MLGWELAWGTQTPITALPPFLPDTGNTSITMARIGQQLMAGQSVCQAPCVAKHGTARETTQNTGNPCNLFLILRTWPHTHGIYS